MTKTEIIKRIETALQSVDNELSNVPDEMWSEFVLCQAGVNAALEALPEE